jgi:hypothetical protein
MGLTSESASDSSTGCGGGNGDGFEYPYSGIPVPTCQASCSDVFGSHRLDLNDHSITLPYRRHLVALFV